MAAMPAMCRGWRAAVVMMPEATSIRSVRAATALEDDGRLLEVPALGEEHPAEPDPFGVDTVLDSLARRSGIGLVLGRAGPREPRDRR